MSNDVPRELKIEQSVQLYLAAQLTARGWVAPAVKLVDSYSHDRFERMDGLDATYVAPGFTFDDGGTPAEMGSSFRRKVHTIEIFVIGKSAAWGSNVSAQIANAIDDEGTLPLYDIELPGNPEIDRLILDEVTRRREPVYDPRPWQENIWTVQLQVADEFYAVEE